MVYHPGRAVAGATTDKGLFYVTIFSKSVDAELGNVILSARSACFCERSGKSHSLTGTVCCSLLRSTLLLYEARLFDELSDVLSTLFLATQSKSKQILLIALPSHENTEAVTSNSRQQLVAVNFVTIERLASLRRIVVEAPPVVA